MFSWSTVYFPLFKFINDKGYSRESSSMISAACGLVTSYPFDGVRLYRQNHKGNYNFWHGFRESFRFTKSNFRSLFIALTRVPLATTFSHMTYFKLTELLNNN